MGGGRTGLRTRGCPSRVAEWDKGYGSSSWQPQTFLKRAMSANRLPVTDFLALSTDARSAAQGGGHQGLIGRH